MHVEFLSVFDHSQNTGIGRYLHTVAHHLSGLVDVTIHRPLFLPLSGRFSPLRNLPIGIENYIRGSIVHFPQIMGCAMMLYRPFHPSVATVHDLGFMELPEEWKMFDPIAKQLLKLSLAGLKRVDKIVTDSEFTRQGVIKHLGIPKDRVVTIYPGIDHELFRPIPNARKILMGQYPQLAAIETAPWLLYVGSEIPRKNVATLLQTVAHVREKMPDIRLVKVGLAGGESFRGESISVINKLGLENNVLFFEGIAEEELPLFYNAADVFITASKLEGFGFPVLEAMACGTPVVCSRAGSLPEVGGTAASYMEVHRVEESAAQICLVVTRTQQAISIDDNLIRNAGRFQWRESASALVGLYEDLEKESRKIDYRI